jgi:dihydrofolate reductase
MVTLDGFFSGPSGELDWHTVDAEFNEYASKLLAAADTLVFGRLTYAQMAAYWPTAMAVNDDPIIAERMNELKKVVFSSSLASADWNNTRLSREDAADEISRMKQQGAGDIVVLGSGQIVRALARRGLIDDYRLLVNPVILGKGALLFDHMEHQTTLKLARVQRFSSGLVGLFYLR